MGSTERRTCFKRCPIATTRPVDGDRAKQVLVSVLNNRGTFAERPRSPPFVNAYVPLLLINNLH